MRQMARHGAKTPSRDFFRGSYEQTVRRAAKTPEHARENASILPRAETNSHSRVPGADKAQARHEPLISSLERGRRNCDVLAKRSHLVFFGSRLIRTRGFSANRVACSARNSEDAPIGDPTGSTPARRSETRTHTPEVWRTELLPSVHFIVYGPDGGCDIVTPLPQSSPRVAYAREGPFAGAVDPYPHAPVARRRAGARASRAQSAREVRPRTLRHVFRF